MRLLLIAAACGAALVASGCTPQASTSDDPADLLDVVLTASDPAPDADDSDGSQQSAQTVRNFSGNITGSGNYKFYDLGQGSRGDEWLVSANGRMSGPFVVVLFDADHNLLMRKYMSYSVSMRHVLRENTGQVFLGIMPPISGNGGAYDLKARYAGGVSVPSPTQQVVWLNFGSGSNVKIHKCDPVSFSAFDAAVIGEEYAGHTQEIKDVILAEMRADYASYNVTILSSDDGVPPAGAYSTVHFGANEPGLLGLADSVDNYNRASSENAIVYVENFAPYWTMRLTPEEMGVMVANVASHELGHLLGLYHTVNHDDLMDSTGSAWDLAGEQGFIGGVLEPSVFATGYEDADNLLGHAVGHNTQAAKNGSQQKAYKTSLYKAIRRFAEEEISHSCGTCLHLDE